MCACMRLVNLLYFTLLDGPNEALLFLLIGFCGWRSRSWELRDSVMGYTPQRSSTLSPGPEVYFSHVIRGKWEADSTAPIQMARKTVFSRQEMHLP